MNVFRFKRSSNGEQSRQKNDIGSLFEMAKYFVGILEDLPSGWEMFSKKHLALFHLESLGAAVQCYKAAEDLDFIVKLAVKLAEIGEKEIVEIFRKSFSQENHAELALFLNIKYILFEKRNWSSVESQFHEAVVAVIRSQLSQIPVFSLLRERLVERKIPQDQVWKLVTYIWLDLIDSGFILPGHETHFVADLFLGFIETLRPSFLNLAVRASLTPSALFLSRRNRKRVFPRRWRSPGPSPSAPLTTPTTSLIPSETQSKP